MGCSENNQHSGLWFMNFSCVLPTSHKGYYTERPIESAAYGLMHAGKCNILQSQSIFLEPLYTLKIFCHLSSLIFLDCSSLSLPSKDTLRGSWGVTSSLHGRDVCMLLSVLSRSSCRLPSNGRESTSGCVPSVILLLINNFKNQCCWSAGFSWGWEV